MTITASAEQRPALDPGEQTSDAEVDAMVEAALAEDAAEPRESTQRVAFVIGGAALCILAALLLSLVAELTVVGSLQHSRDQQVDYASLRSQLAEGTAPTGQLDSNGGLLAPGTPVALLRIPALGIDEVVAEGTTSSILVSGPGHRRDSVMPGQPGTSVIFGRQAAYGGPFGRLIDLPVGSPIEVVNGQGTFTYIVSGVRGPGAPQPATLEPGKGRLTLVTATGTPYTAAGTLRVDAELQGAAAELPSRVLGAGSLEAAERPMSGDPAAWIPLVFWAQGLLLAAIGFVLLLSRWGRWQAWVVGVPVLSFVGLGVAGQVALLLPNLL
jgi:sortase A